MNLPNIIQRAYNRPLLMEPTTAVTFFAVLSKRIGAAQLHTLDESLNAEEMQLKADSYVRKQAHILGESQFFDDDRHREYAVVQNIAVINVMGTLVNRSSYLGTLSGLVGYNQLLTQARAADADPEVDGIFFHADSGGGEVAGCFDTVEAFANLQKPTAWFSDEMSASAAYALSCGADTHYAPRTANIGSIGVLVAHENHAQAVADQGVEVTLIHSGARKVDGNPYEALSADVLSSIQKDLDETRILFAQTVADHRPIALADVLATEAAVYNGSQAQNMGLIDHVMSRDEAFAHFSASLFTEQPPTLSGTVSPPNQGVIMATTEQGARAEESGEALQDQLAYSTSELSAAVQSAKALAKDAESDRIFAIIESPEAEGRMATAIQLAKSGTAPEAAAAILATIPQAAPATPAAPAAPSANDQALRMMSHADIVSTDQEVTTAVTAPKKPFIL